MVLVPFEFFFLELTAHRIEQTTTRLEITQIQLVVHHKLW